MKRIAILLLAAVFIAVFAACSKTDEQSAAGEESAQSESVVEPDPTKPDGAVSEILESAKNWDTDAAAAFLPEGTTLEQYVPVALHDSLAQALSRMEYEVTGLSEDAGRAEVQLNITAVDAESAMNDAIVSAAAYVAKQKLAGNDIEDYSALAEVVADSIDIAGLPTKTSPATAYMVETGDGTWRLDLSDDRNLPLLNAASGGSVDLADRFIGLAQEYGIALG